MFIPRIGQEVIVEFLEGNPDHPRIENDDSPPRWLCAGRGQNQTLGHDETLQVKNDRSKSVDKNPTETIGENKTIAVGKNHSESVGDGATITVGKDLRLTVDKSRIESMGNNHSESIGNNADMHTMQKSFRGQLKIT